MLRKYRKVAILFLGYFDIIGKMMYHFETEEALLAFGYELGKRLVAGDVVLLEGDLGAGKTTITKGIAKGLGISQLIKSPTYTIVREYEGRLPLYHLDVYRLGDDIDAVGLEEMLTSTEVVVIEWADLLDDSMFETFLRIRINYAGLGREVSLETRGKMRHLLEEDNI